jgi:hypothetical protein
LIASGLMAGAAIIGVIGAFLLLPPDEPPLKWIGGLGLEHAPIRYVDAVYMSTSAGSGAFSNWYGGMGGQLVSVLGLAGLVLCCYLLARVGARWQRDEERSAE